MPLHARYPYMLYLTLHISPRAAYLCSLIKKKCSNVVSQLAVRVIPRRVSSDLWTSRHKRSAVVTDKYELK